MRLAMTVNAERYPVAGIEARGFQKALAANVVRCESPARMAIDASLTIALADEFAPAP
jgi:hypothetical protein